MFRCIKTCLLSVSICLLAFGCVWTERDAHLQWRDLFDGKSLAGWHTLPGGRWDVVDGVIVGTSPEAEENHGLLVTDRTFKDFVVRLKFKVNAGDSGFYFRVIETGKQVGVKGFQVEIDSSYETGGLYETDGRGWVVVPDADIVKSVYTPGQWAQLTLTAVEGDVTVTINGLTTAQLKSDPGNKEGHLALQLHGGMDMHVEYKDIQIRELPTETKRTDYSQE